ncbi:MAG: hypothetical protein O7I93_06720 [Gemmatimonadetes bacterium]|nr:hypothetical protein [Gemmatimonadota bacterium]
MEDKQEERSESKGKSGGASDYWAAERKQESWLEKAQKAAKAKKATEETESES